MVPPRQSGVWKRTWDVPHSKGVSAGYGQASEALDAAQRLQREAAGMLAEFRVRRAQLQNDQRAAEQTLGSAETQLVDDEGATQEFERAFLNAERAKGATRALDELIRKTEARLAEADAQADVARTTLTYWGAHDAVAEAADTLRAEYPSLGARLQKLIDTVAKATAAADEVNSRGLPSGLPPLRSPEELVRDRPAIARQVLSEHLEDLWVNSDGTPMGANRQADVIPGRDPSIGTLVLSGSTRQQVRTVEKRQFLRREYLEEVPRQTGPRLSKLYVPGLTAADPAFWEPQVTDQLRIATVREIISKNPYEPARVRGIEYVAMPAAPSQA